MRRREVLALTFTGVATAIAGCGGDGGDGNTNGNGNGNGGNQPQAPPVSEAVELVSHELQRTNKGSFTEQVSVVGQARNTSDAQLPRVVIRARFYDESDQLLQTHFATRTSVNAGFTWSFEIEFVGRGSEARQVADYDLSVGSNFPTYTPS